MFYNSIKDLSDEKFSKLLEHESITVADNNGSTPLHWLCNNNNLTEKQLNMLKSTDKEELKETHSIPSTEEPRTWILNKDMVICFASVATITLVLCLSYRFDLKSKVWLAK